VRYFAVIREAGPGWHVGQGIGGQDGLSDHAEFMNLLATEGFVLVAGPLAGSEAGDLRVLLIVTAGSEAEIHRRLADDPWMQGGQLLTASVEPWTVVVGEGRLSHAARV
jgi:uncharacterized protein YciI